MARYGWRSEKSTTPMHTSSSTFNNFELVESSAEYLNIYVIDDREKSRLLWGLPMLILVWIAIFFSVILIIKTPTEVSWFNFHRLDIVLSSNSIEYKVWSKFLFLYPNINYKAYQINHSASLTRQQIILVITSRKSNEFNNDRDNQLTQLYQQNI